jgi:hypothetical protein
MGYTTDFVGQVEIDPPLNAAETMYLLAFAASRRYHRPGGPYEVPGNPAAERDESPADTTTYNTVASGQPSLWCDWQPAWDGCCLAPGGAEKFYGAAEWVAYLIDHFLKPNASAQTVAAPWFVDFTFDHQLNGIVAGSRRDTHGLFLIEVEDNVVREHPLLVPRSRPEGAGLLPYEASIDQLAARRVRRREDRE